MKTIIINMLVLLSLGTIANGQNKKTNLPKPITISGYVSDTCIKVFSDTLILYFHNNYNDQLWREGKKIPVTIKNNRFSVTIQPEGQISYFQLRDGKKTSNLMTTLKFGAFLVEAGDQLSFNFKKPKEIAITGKAAEKLNYQHFAGKLAIDGGRNWKSYTIKDQNQIDYWRRLNDEHLRMAIDSLNKIKPIMSLNAYNTLKYNTTATININYIQHLTTVIVHQKFLKKDSSYIKSVQNELSTMDNTQRSFASTDQVILQLSSNYISYLGDFLITYHKVLRQKDSVSFDQLFDKISNEYNGTLRDKLVTYVINECYKNYGSHEFIPKALNFVKDPISTRILTNLIKFKSKGVRAYDFSFEGLNGKRVKLQDLKGKVVVLEAWFNGCSGCIGLAERMHPIIEQYKNNKNVVFISLGVDRDKGRFLAGVKSGKYGSQHSVYAYTNGKGWEHPICLQYQWSNHGFPQMLFIDKNGDLISTEKIDPLNDVKKQELITLINMHL